MEIVQFLECFGLSSTQIEISFSVLFLQKLRGEKLSLSPELKTLGLCASMQLSLSLSLSPFLVVFFSMYTQFSRVLGKSKDCGIYSRKNRIIIIF